MVLQFDPKQYLPPATELPDSDDTPVDNELQNLIPNLLEAILAMIWPDRQDWFFGVDMGIYFAPNQPAIVPDGFLSLGVQRFVGEGGRLSYVLWEENNIAPTLALEVVSKTYGKEYEHKQDRYADLGIDYYVVYIPDGHPRRNHQPFEVYQLVGEGYQLLEGDPIWLPKIGLGLGRSRGVYLGREREWLYWYDESGQRLCTPEERIIQESDRAEQERARAEQESDRAEQERARAEQEKARAEQESDRAKQEKARAERLANKLRALGIDPGSI